MGTKCAPSYAIIFEEKFLLTHRPVPLVWWRYIDDIFMIWPHTREELYSFIDALNKVHSSIKFRVGISKTQANFLDVTIYKDPDGNITTGLYTKPAGAFMYLHYSSYHPRHQKTCIPYSQAIRLRRICSTNELFQQATSQLEKNLINRGYPKQLIVESIQKASTMDIHAFLQPQTLPKQNLKIIPFTVIHNPLNPPFVKICKKNRHILSSAPDLQDLLTYKVMIVNKRATNLKNILTKTDISTQIVSSGSSPCNAPCISRKFMKQTRSITVWITKETIPIWGRYNCKTKNAIYILSCAKCSLQYVGQTGNTFNKRFRAHLTDIRQRNTIKPVSRNSCLLGTTSMTSWLL